jgi:hypothetical protein
MVSRGLADEEILESYHAERWPVGRTLLRATDRIFAAVERSVSRGSYAAALRRLIVRHVIAPALSRRRIRSIAFHFVSQLGIRYANSPIVTEGIPHLRSGPRAGDRLPDGRVRCGTQTTYLQEELLKPCMVLLLCGPVGAWNSGRLRDLAHEFQGLLGFTHLSRDGGERVLMDEEGNALARLGVESAAQYLIRPDGHVAFRCAGTDVTGVEDYLRRWFVSNVSR